MLAVLPFENLTGDPDQEYISDGMTEELIAQLGGMDPSRLGVIARQSAMQFKKTTKRADQIGSDLGVSHLLAGSLRRTGSRIRIAVQLIDTESESQLWAEQYQRDAMDLLALQREVAEAITRQITTSLGVARSNVYADARRHSTIAEAYEHYLRGRHHLWRRDTAEGFEKAREHFQKAIDLDDSYALAYSGLADTYTMLGAAGFLPMREAYPLAKAAALKAIALDDRLAEAHNSLAFILADYYWDWDTGRSPFQARHRAEPELRDCRPHLFLLSGLVGAGQGGARVRRAGARSGPGVAERTAEPWPGPLLRPSLRRSHHPVSRDARSRSELRPGPRHAGTNLCRQGSALIEPSRSSSAPKVSWVLAPTSSPPWLTSLRGPDAGARRLRRSTNCGASRSHGIHRPFVSPTCTSASEIRIERSNGFRRRSRHGIGRWACSRSSPRSMACAQIRGSLHCSSASASHDKRQS